MLPIKTLSCKRSTGLQFKNKTFVILHHGNHSLYVCIVNHFHTIPFDPNYNKVVIYIYIYIYICELVFAFCVEIYNDDDNNNNNRIV